MTAALTDLDASDLTIDSLAEIYRRLKKSVAPSITAIWFVDCPWAYHDFIDQFPEMASYKAPNPFVRVRIDIIQWETCFFDPETEVIAEPGDDVSAMLRRGNMEKIIWPWICKEPGMWVHWSDGRYHKFLMGE